MTKFEVDCSAITNGPKKEIEIPFEVIRSDKFETKLKEAALEAIVDSLVVTGRHRLQSSASLFSKVRISTDGNLVCEYNIPNAVLLDQIGLFYKKRDEDRLKKREEEEKVFFQNQKIRRDRVPKEFHEFLSRIAREIEQEDHIPNLDIIEERVYSEFEKVWTSYLYTAGKSKKSR